jgi:hypothetical protein
MSYNVHTLPATYSAAYSQMPLRVSSDTVDTSDAFNYLVKIAYHESTVNDIETYVYNQYTYAKVTTSATHSYVIGDNVYLDDSYNDDVYTNSYTIVDNLDTTHFVIDLTLGPAFGPVPSRMYKSIPFKNSKGVDDELRLDSINQTIKDFVTYNLEDSNEIYAGTNTKFNYKLILGESFDYVFDFEDNGYFYSVGYGNPGQISFYNTGATSLNGIPFQIGDEVVVQQDLASWEYDYVEGNAGGGLSGLAAFVGSTTHNFLAGQQVTVTGQVTEPYYNGVTTVDFVGGSNYFTSVKNYNTIVPNEPGVITGVPRPSYNTTCNITDINLSGTYGVVISVDVLVATASQPISGTIKFNSLTTDSNAFVSNNLYAYNARINNLDYTPDAFDPYVIQNRLNLTNNISTILGTHSQYRIEPESKFWLLSHCYKFDFVDSARFNFYDNIGATLSSIRLNSTLSDNREMYVPCGIDQLIQSNNITLLSGATLSTIKDSVDTYTVHISDNTGLGTIQKSNKIRFYINDDCSNYDTYHIMWKDSLGSWLTYPFKYLATKGTEVERKTYYTNEVNWDTDNNTFGIDTFGRGEKAYYSRNRQKITLNSGWIDSNENALIKDMFESLHHFVQHPDGTLEAVILSNNSIQYGSVEKDRVWNYTFDINMSRNEIRL